MHDGPTRARPPTIVRYATARLTVTKGPDRGLVIDAAGTPIRIGVDPANDLVLTDDSVSRHHCEVELTEGGVRLRDRGSTNGVNVDSIRVYDAVLPGDVRFTLGDTEITVAALPSVVEREQAGTDRFGEVRGAAPRMRELFATLGRLAGSDVSALIEGETGAGKDLVAESLHREGPRAEGPFVVLECGGLTAEGIEAVVFGREEPGVFEQADGGTILLDEIGELPRELQPTLLRVLERLEVRRVGSPAVRKVDVRVLATTSRNLRADVSRGTFRQDLYFRIAGAVVVVPPLRDRLEDLEMLVHHFLALEGAGRTDVPPHVWRLFSTYRWPGNVRELRNAVRRLMLTPDDPLGVPAQEAAAVEIRPLPIARREATDAFERAYIATVMARANGNVSRAATLADVSRQMMQKLLRKHGRE
jgi:DNA-binding NtrC family response regulator